MDRFLALVVMGCAIIGWRVIWGLVRLGMSWPRRTVIATIYAAAAAALFYTLQRCDEPVAAWLVVPLYGGAALLVLTVNDPVVQLMQRVAEQEGRNRIT